MKGAIRYLVISVLTAVLITSATYFVTVEVNGRFLSGFPIPYVTFTPFVSYTGPYNVYVYNFVNLAGDVAIWTAISSGVGLSSTSGRRLLIGGAAGS
ncbi:MAG: hypothetical protein OK456_08410 [Thaumarchaeota archaeon]|nr:hypothetical protein [Nitrososphaerota archaeon]